VESKAEIVVGIDKVRKEVDSFLQGRSYLPPKEAYELLQYAKNRTRLDVSVEQLTGEEMAWREVHRNLDDQFTRMFGPQTKLDMDSLEEQIETAQIVASALERLARQPLWRRAWISIAIRFWKTLYKVGKFLGGES